MANSKPDENSRGTLIALASDGSGAIVPLYADKTTHRLLVDNAGSSGGITVGTTTITGGTTTRVLFDNAGVVGEYAISGTGSVAMTNSPTFVTPTLGVATATTINKITFTAPTTAATLTFGVDNTTQTFQGSDTIVGRATTDTLTNKTLTTPVLNGTPTGTGVATAGTASTLVLRDTSGNTTAVNAISGLSVVSSAGGTTTLTVASPHTIIVTGTFTQDIVLPVAATLTLGLQYYIYNASSSAAGVVIRASGLGVIFTLAGSESITATCISLAGTDGTSWQLDQSNVKALTGKSGTFNNILTLAGTDSTTMTFPSTSATIARTDAANTFTGVQTFSNAAIHTNNAITASGNAATVPVTSDVNTVTNNSAATLTITMTTASAVNRQFSEVLILDSSAAAQTITWVNTENSTVSAPTTSNGSVTLPLSVLFQYNSATSKWRCIASA